MTPSPYSMGQLSLGKNTLSASTRDGRTVKREILVEEGANRVELVLEEGVEVRGRVVDAAGDPSSLAQISLRGVWKATDDEGRWTARVTLGRYWLNVRKDGYSRFYDQVELPVEDGSVIVTRLHRQAIVGQLLGVDAEDTQAVTVRAEGPGHARGQAAYDRTYRIDGLSPGEWQVIAEVAVRGLSARGWLTLEEGVEETELDLRFEEGLSLHLRVVDGDRAASGERVSSLSGIDVLDNRRGETDYRGEIRFRSLVAGATD